MLFKKLVLVLLLVVSSYSSDDIYFLPDQSKEAFSHIEDLIKDSKKQINIAVYNFEYKKIAKLLKKAAKKGVKVNILFDDSKLKNKKSKFEYLCSEKNVQCKVEKEKKQHIKLMLFDDKSVLLGSANLTKESFTENLELIFISQKDDLVKKTEKFFKKYFDK